MKAFTGMAMIMLLGATAACGGGATADGNNTVAATTNGSSAPIANDSETANSATGMPVGGEGADPADVNGLSEGEGPGDKPTAEDAADEAVPAEEQAPAGNEPQ